MKIVDSDPKIRRKNTKENRKGKKEKKKKKYIIELLIERKQVSLQTYQQYPTTPG
jgi:hypothetical protein